ncbi:MAG TPA: retropepsin-like aspartic protease [Gemmatimonadales bacterium]
MSRTESLTALASLLAAARFQRVPLVRTGVGHFEAAGTLNGTPIRVLIDTGAASTVLSLNLVRRLGLELVPLGPTGGGAGGANLEVFEVRGAELRLGEVVPRPEMLVAMDLSHADAALAQQGAGPVEAILGVDVYEAQAAVIDYGSASLFLQEAVQPRGGAD